MATIVFDGTSNQTATAADTVVFTALPTSITNVSEAGGNVAFSVGSFTLTITGQTLAGLSTSLFTVPNGSAIFGDGASTTAADVNNNNLASSNANNILFGLQGGDVITLSGTAAGNTLIVGGSAFVDTVDGADQITLTGKGSFTVYGNAGADSIAGNGLGAGASVSINAGIGNDTVNLSTATTSVVGGIFGAGGSDSINVLGVTGTNVSIFGGAANVDTADAADTVIAGGTGTFSLYGNGGADSIQLTGVTAATTVNAFGGAANDTLNIDGGAFALNGSYVGGEGSDNVSVTGSAGSTITVIGGVASVDSADLADTIDINGGGSFTVFGNAGADSIDGQGINLISTVNVNGGSGADTIDLLTTAQLTGSVFGAADSDNISVAGGANSNISIYGGSSSADAADTNDSIRLQGQGTYTVFGNGGNDSISSNTLAGATTVSINGGAGADTVDFSAATAAVKGSIFGAEGADSINVAGVAGTAVSIFGGSSAGDAELGADTLVVGGIGAFTVDGGAGADALNFAMTQGGAYTVTGAGGAGADVFKLNQSADGGTTGLFTLTGGADSDTYILQANFDGSLGANIAAASARTVITDFTAGAGGDAINVTALAGANTALAQGGTFATLALALADGGAPVAANATVAVQVGTDTYIIANNGTADFVNADDTVIKLTGVTATNLVAANVLIA